MIDTLLKEFGYALRRISSCTEKRHDQDFIGYMATYLLLSGKSVILMTRPNKHPCDKLKKRWK